MLKVSFSRIYQFSAAHRLHSPYLSEEENRKIYDKCNNLYGHGHNYYLEVTVWGTPDSETGMVYSLEHMDFQVGEVLNQLEHKHLNNEIPYFKENPTTGEVIVQYLWQELIKKIPEEKLYHLKLWETKNNFFEIGKEI